jgi:4-amino-4-deoxy-L-arabinose transferase-like glycosyltransferase
MRWAQQGSPSSHWTTALSDQWYLVGLVSIFIAHLFLAVTLPPAEDELYYWTWSQSLSGSYFDHPPMVAWWILVTTKLLGNGLLGIRFSAIFAHLFILFGLGTLSPNKNILGLLLLTPLSLFGGILMSPDVPLLVFWFLYMKWALGLEERFAPWGDDPVTRVYRKSPVGWGAWLNGGLLLGLGLLSKYTMALAPFCLIILLFTRYRWKAWLPGFILHLLIASVLFSPVLFFNLKYQFRPLLFQWNHTQGSVPFSFLFTYLGNQTLLLGALPFLFLPWVIISFSKFSRVPSFRALACFYLAPLLFFLFKATHHFLEANWGLVAYLAFWPIATFLIEHSSFRGFTKTIVLTSFLAPLLVSGIVFIHLIHPLAIISSHQDRIAKLKAQFDLSRKAATEIPPLSPIYLSSYQWTSYFRYFGLPQALQLPDQGRASQYTLKPSSPCDFESVFLFTSSGSAAPDSLNCFKNHKTISEYPLIIRGAEHGKLTLTKFTNPKKAQ